VSIPGILSFEIGCGFAQPQRRPFYVDNTALPANRRLALARAKEFHVQGFIDFVPFADAPPADRRAVALIRRDRVATIFALLCVTAIARLYLLAMRQDALAMTINRPREASFSIMPFAQGSFWRSSYPAPARMRRTASPAAERFSWRISA
jgi:hypothetical protein